MDAYVLTEDTAYAPSHI